MSSPVKHLLVYADGHVEESKSCLEGNRFIQQYVDEHGNHWQREFEIELAYDRAPGRPGEFKTCSVVALERQCTLRRTAEQVLRDDEESRAKLLARITRALFEDDD